MAGILPELTSEVTQTEDISATIVETQKENTFKSEFVFDFEKGEFKTDTMNKVMTAGSSEEVLKGIVNKVLHDERYHYLIYGDNYGSEITALIKQDNPFEVFSSELKRVVREALIYHPFIEDVQDITVTQEGVKVYCEFNVIGVNGIYLHDKEEVIT